MYIYNMPGPQVAGLRLPVIHGDSAAAVLNVACFARPQETGAGRNGAVPGEILRKAWGNLGKVVKH